MQFDGARHNLAEASLLAFGQYVPDVGLALLQHVSESFTRDLESATSTMTKNLQQYSQDLQNTAQRIASTDAQGSSQLGRH